jgi:NADH:ubiquinone oxidoreductase subunit 5 (subunit L)/multisubunit Na+/H+ antiporter MnhA subunit
MALTLGILLIFFVFSTLTFETVFSLIDEYFFFNQNIFCNQQESILLNKIYSFCLQNKFSFIALFLFIGAMGKSAQIGLHT